MILDRFIEQRAEETTLGPLTSKGVVASLLSAAGGMSTAGVAVDEWKAEGLPAMYACQRAISETVGHLPMKLLETRGRDRVPATSDPLYGVLHDLMNPELTAYDGREMMTRWLAGWGRSYAEIEWDHDRVVALWPLMPWRMKVDRDEKNRKRWTYTAPNGRTFDWVFNAAKPPILHLMVNSLDGLDGRSPVRVHIDTIGAAAATRQFGADFMKNYASPGVVATFPGKLSSEAKNNIRNSWEEMRGTWGQKHRMAVLTEGMKVEKMSCPPDEAQFIETYGLHIEEMARIYRVPLFIIQHMTKSTAWGSGIEQMMLGWLSTGLSPYLVNWQQAVMRDCVTSAGIGRRQVVWVTGAIVKTAFLDQQKALEIQKRNGVVNANEWRGLLDLNPRTDAMGEAYDVPNANSKPYLDTDTDTPLPSTGAAETETTS